MRARSGIGTSRQQVAVLFVVLAAACGGSVAGEPEDSEVADLGGGPTAGGTPGSGGQTEGVGGDDAPAGTGGQTVGNGGAPEGSGGASEGSGGVTGGTGGIGAGGVAEGSGGASGGSAGSGGVGSGGAPEGIGGVAEGSGGAGVGGSGGTTEGSGGAGVGGSGGTTEECLPPPAVPGVAALYDRESALAADGSDTTFFDFPWPEISRPFSDVLGYPNPPEASGCNPGGGSELATLVTAAIEPYDYRKYLIELSDFWLQTPPRHPGVFIAFDGQLDTARLPTPAESLAPSAHVFLLDVDGASPDFGQRVPIVTRVYQNSHYLPENTLAAVPAAGFPLRSSTRYALVVLRSLLDASGNPLGSSAAFEEKKLGLLCGPAADANYSSVFAALFAEKGIDPETVAAMTIFESGDPTAPLETLRPNVEAFTPPSHLGQVTIYDPAVDAGGGVHVVEGTLGTLIHQVGSPPYLPQMSAGFGGVTVTLSAASQQGSFIEVGPAVSPGPAAPTAPRTEAVDFVLTLPDQLLGGLAVVDVPLVIYAPGTGGSRYSALDEGIADDLAALGMATLSITPVMHQERAHAENISTALLNQLGLADAIAGTDYQDQLIETVESGQLFFNPLNLQAARGNSLQAAVDGLWLAHLFSETAVEVWVDETWTTVLFDPEHVSFFGHSQGASTGALLSGSTELSGAVLSGVSGYLPTALLHKTEPSDQLGIAPMLDYIVCDDPSEPLDETHPILTLLGHFLEPADAELYAEQFVFGAAPKDLFIIAGRDDGYAPPSANHAVTTAARLHQVVVPAGVVPGDVPGQALLNVLRPGYGYGATYAVRSANFGNVTGAFRQYHDALCADDHFVYSCNEPARGDWISFFESGLLGPPWVP